MDQPLIEDRVHKEPWVVRIDHGRVGAGNPVVPEEPVLHTAGSGFRVGSNKADPAVSVGESDGIRRAQMRSREGAGGRRRSPENGWPGGCAPRTQLILSDDGLLSNSITSLA